MDQMYISVVLHSSCFYTLPRESLRDRGAGLPIYMNVRRFDILFFGPGLLECSRVLVSASIS
jgi:hypothetical protein